MIKRSSDIPARETELDKSVDEIAQMIVEAGHDWRKPYYAGRGLRWCDVRRAA